ALIAIVERGESQESELALRALAKLGPQASPAIVAVSKKLGDPDHAIRSAAADALVAIGDPCVTLVRKLVDFPNPRSRAAAAQVRGRLKNLDLDDLTRLAKDADPRVRAAAASGLAQLGKPGVPGLAAMLDDPEPAVSVEASRGLRTNRADASIAISGLTRALSRTPLAGDVIDALVAYGVEARQALPAIIEAYRLGERDYSSQHR